jgi:membrane protease YdiL (CAAX protease family)
MPAFLRQIPTVVWFGALAFVLTVVTGGVWTVLLAVNLATSAAIPWSVVVMAALLWLMWRYFGGAWGPGRTSQARKLAMRARMLPVHLFAWALVAGGLALVALVGFWIVLVQLVKLPARVLPGFSSYPLLTILLVLLMASLVSTLAEEIGFRGYFQGTLEGKVSIPAAIVIAALVIAPAHSLTQGFLWPILLWYFCADVMFGALAALTRSILPGMVIHSIGLLIFFAFIWPNDAQRPLVLESGADVWFWIHLAQIIIGAALALLAFRYLAALAKRERVAEVAPAPLDKPSTPV